MKLQGKVGEMKGLFLSIMIFGTGLVLIGNSHAADKDPVKSSPDGEKQIQGVKKQDELPEQTQKQYIARLERINADLRNKHSAFAQNYSLTRANNEKMNSDLQWGYGSISNQLLKSLQDLAAERTALEAAIKGLEQEKVNLRSDVLSFYGGKIPERLSQQWDKEEKAYLDYVDNIYLQIQWLLESPKWKGEEKVFRDFMLEYYRLRQKGSRE